MVKDTDTRPVIEIEAGAWGNFCSYCGQAFRSDADWPRTCPACGNTSYRNPLPVAAVLLPVDDGLLLVRRGIGPRQGKFTFPGGFVDYGESWQEAAVRELREEACVVIEPDELEPFHVESTSRGHMVIVFGLARPRRRQALPAFQPTPEVSERDILRELRELAFPQDVNAARKYFHGTGGHRRDEKFPS